MNTKKKTGSIKPTRTAQKIDETLSWEWGLKPTLTDERQSGLQAEEIKWIAWRRKGNCTPGGDKNQIKYNCRDAVRNHKVTDPEKTRTPNMSIGGDVGSFKHEWKRRGEKQIKGRYDENMKEIHEGDCDRQVVLRVLNNSDVVKRETPHEEDGC